jgi:hypothetical protein
MRMDFAWSTSWLHLWLSAAPLFRNLTEIWAIPGRRHCQLPSEHVQNIVTIQYSCLTHFTVGICIEKINFTYNYAATMCLHNNTATFLKSQILPSMLQWCSDSYEMPWRPGGLCWTVLTDSY